jgi:hypothetical protein
VGQAEGQHSRHAVSRTVLLAVLTDKICAAWSAKAVVKPQVLLICMGSCLDMQDPAALHCLLLQLHLPYCHLTGV